jgi:hypothetical protein
VTADSSWLSVCVAALATLIIGGPWHSATWFLRPWQRAMGLTSRRPGHPVRVFGLTYLCRVGSSAALASRLGPADGAAGGLRLGLTVGTVGVAASHGTHFQFAYRSPAALCVDAGLDVLQFATSGTAPGVCPGD